MSAPLQSAAELQARADEALAGFRRGAREIRQRGEQARQAIVDATGEATSRDGAVTVDVTFDGAVRSLRFGPDIAALGADRLAAEVIATIRTATADAIARAKAGVIAALGPDNAAVSVLDRRLAETGAAPATEPPAPATDEWQGRG